MKYSLMPWILPDTCSMTHTAGVFKDLLHICNDHPPVTLLATLSFFLLLSHTERQEEEQNGEYITV